MTEIIHVNGTPGTASEKVRLYFGEDADPTHNTRKIVSFLEEEIDEATKTLNSLPSIIADLKDELSKWEAVNEAVIKAASETGFLRSSLDGSSRS